METLLVAFRATVVTLVLTGIAYPLVVTAGAQLLMPYRANGSIVVDDKGQEVGSELIGQGFASAAYVGSRPSANANDASNSGGTNLGTTSKKLRDDVRELAAAFRNNNGLVEGAAVPADVVTRSASGLDPDVTPETALLEAARIAKARGVTVERVESVIDDYVEERDLGFLGEPHVNVLAVNLALDRKFGRPPHQPAGGGATMPR